MTWNKCRIVVFDFFEPFGMDFVPPPLVGEDSGIAPFPFVYIVSCGATAVPFGIEWWVGGDEVNGLAVHTTKHV